MNELKKLLLAGIGGASLSYEKVEDMVDMLIERGQMTVSQGRELSQELMRRRQGDSSNEDGTLSGEEMQALLLSMNVAQRTDLEELERKIDQLNDTLSQMNTKK